MIAEIKFKNLFSFRDEAVFSFEADKSKEMESYHVVEIVPGVRLLKFAVIYGANASGKSNVMKICYFLKNFILHTPKSKTETTGVLPFLLDQSSQNEDSEIAVSFYVCKRDLTPIKYTYSLSLNRNHVTRESLVYYTSQQPTTVFERWFENGVSTIKFGGKIKLSSAAKEEIALKCLPNMSTLAAYMQVNLIIAELEDVLSYFSGDRMQTLASFLPQRLVSIENLKEENEKQYIVKYLQEADFNISDIYAQDNVSVDSLPRTMFQHKVQQDDDAVSYYEFPDGFESEGTLRTLDLAGYINELIKRDGLLTVDEVESSLHHKLVEFIIEKFLRESNKAQLIVTTHYDGLLAQDDLLRNENIWFTEKNRDGATVLYPLTDFNGLNRISSLQKAYRFGKFGAIPNI
ncbi:AAA family ATPase [Bacteroides graminisolvens]|uniref:ATPase AAA-type core domain-containing protein n=1 Tax=Bacteroides graminisolvens DSM 19988 = JCM 15093 TaxID=1121097 RepID=A0A069D8A3_9BACE|nr:ATP-binding protein [Bacteroides graminisolvens]GAK36469.1 hypothetical protein JCM15093_1637 [Bacteroides graminisolvens DSM 19988 = JCM 15093]